MLILLVQISCQYQNIKGNAWLKHSQPLPFSPSAVIIISLLFACVRPRDATIRGISESRGRQDMGGGRSTLCLWEKVRYDCIIEAQARRKECRQTPYPVSSLGFQPTKAHSLGEDTAARASSLLHPHPLSQQRLTRANKTFVSPRQQDIRHSSASPAPTRHSSRKWTA